MMEIEKRFIITEEQKEKLIESAEFLGEKIIIDSYWDDSDYSLTTKDLWLRQRGESFELKIPMNADLEERVSDQYREVEVESEIAEYFNFPKHIPLDRSLNDTGYKPFVRLVTTRQKYKKDGFGFDFDSVDFGYEIMEIEFMTDDESGVDEATRKIVEYAKSYGLSEDYVRGKVGEYLRLKNPKHFDALVEAKIIK